MEVTRIIPSSPLITRVQQAAWLRVRGLRSNFKFDKKEIIDYAFQRCTPRPQSFADLGGMWGVEGAYTFYTLGKYPVQRAFLVDDLTTPAFEKRARNFSQLQLVTGNFCEPAVAAKTAPVDAVFMFDVLLHQVHPNWDQVLREYAKHARYFVIYNQQWIGSKETVRLFDLGEDEYFRNVPHDRSHPAYSGLFRKLDEMHPQLGCTWREASAIWQWGIVDDDLIATLESAGFQLQLYKNCGQFGSLRNFENHAFVFQKRA